MQADRIHSPQRPLDIVVHESGFGRGSRADIAAVAQSAGSELMRHCPRIELPGIEVYHRADHPRADFERTPAGRIAIGLSAHDTYWAQYSFQFAHEFCHALARHASGSQWRGSRDLHGPNLWLEESLCETASLFALRAMARTWRTAPPYPAWTGYAAALNAYAEQRLGQPEHRLPAGTSFPQWFRENQPALRRNPVLRASNAIVASRLLPLFESQPGGWETVAFLPCDPRGAEASFDVHLAEWRAQCPAALRPFVTKLAVAFGVKQ